MLRHYLPLQPVLGSDFSPAAAADNFYRGRHTMLILARPSHKYTTLSIKSDRFCHTTGHHFKYEDVEFIDDQKRMRKQKTFLRRLVTSPGWESGY